jgi:LacI family transcriptional regulator
VRKTRKARLSDVAALANVSATTASYILNGRSAQMRISPETEARVRRAAAELDYRPNASARNLRTARTRTIGVVSDLVAGGQFASQMLTGASAAARRRDHVIVIGESQGDAELEALLIGEMLERGVDGLVYATMVTAEITASRLLQQERTVLLNCFDRTASLPAVVPDEYDGGRRAAEEVLAGGVAGEVYVVGEMPSPGAIAGRLRLDGISDALAAAHVPLAGVVACDWSVPAAYEAVHAFLARGRPSALICLNDRIAMGAYQALALHGLEIPYDVSVVSFDGSELADWLRPRLTSVVLPYAELGERAVDLLLDGQARTGVTRVPMPVARGASVRSRGRVRPF